MTAQASTRPAGGTASAAEMVLGARTLRTAVVQISALLVSVALLVLGSGLQGTLLGVRAGLEGMAEESIGVMMSAFFAGFVFGSVFCPRLVHQVGAVRTFAALASIASAVALAHVLLISPLTWVLFRAIHGACYASLILIAESWLNGYTSRDYRGRVLAIYGIFMIGAWACSQPLLNVAPPAGFVLFRLVSILLSLSLVPIALTRATEPGVVAASRLSVKRLYRISPVGTVGVCAVGLTMSALWGMGPRFAQMLGLDEAGISAFMALTMLGALVSQWPIGALSDRVDRRKIILWLSVATGAASLALATGPDRPLSLLLVLGFFFGAFAIPSYSLCLAHTNDYIDSGELVAAASGLILIYGVGAALSPFLASLLMGQIGPQGLFVHAAAVQVLFVLFCLYRMTQRGPVPKEAREKFVHVPRTTHAILELDERSPDRGTPRRSDQSEEPGARAGTGDEAEPDSRNRG